jgi:PBP1b-binding outer membrane lipoprotein LpoB
MHRLIMLTAALALAGCSQERAADPAIENDVASANTAVKDAQANTAAQVALASLNETTWEFTDPKTKKPMQESIDASGNYIVNSGKEHIDHGTAAIKNGKSCFTSAMKKDGEECWTDPVLAIGQSGVATSDKGEKLTIKRVDYVPLTM